MRILSILAASAALATASIQLPAQTVRLEAEDARLEGPGLQIVRPAVNADGQPDSKPEPETSPASKSDAHQLTGYSGTGYVTGFGQPESRLLLTYDAPHAGIYDLTIGFLCSGKNSAYLLEINAPATSGLSISGAFSPQTPGAFESQSAGRIELNAGPNTIAIGRGWGRYALDFIELSPSGPITVPQAPTAEPSDPQATPEARALLKRLDQGYTQGALMGVYSEEDARYVLDQTGFRPAVLGADLSTYSPSSMQRKPHPSEIVEHMIAHAREGYLLTFSWHWVPPFGLLNRKIEAGDDGKPAIDARWNRGFYTEATSFDVSIAVDDPDSLERTYLLRDIDAIAVQLKKLQAANIPILWRPLHEAQGGWFWWGAKGPKPFIQLWQLLYDRLVNYNGIHNLIWVYTSADDPAWYPGDAFVDVVGIDAYPEDLRDPQSELWTRMVANFASRKPLALSEFGGVPDIARMRRLGVDWVFAVSWNGSEGPRKNTPEALKAIYANDRALKQLAK